MDRKRVEVYVLRPDGVLAIPCAGRSPSMPGGGVDDGESLLVAAERELMEEAGWIASAYRVLPHEATYPTAECKWLEEKGYTSETQYAVVCMGVAFKPDERYGSEGDDDMFKPMSLMELRTRTKQFMDNMTPFGIHYDRAKFRLHVLDSMLANKPNYLAW